MKALSIICGILLIICGFCCIFTPITAYISYEYLILIMIAVCGIIGLVRSISNKNFGFGFAVSIISIILSLVMLIFRNVFVITNYVLIYIIAAWFLIQAIMMIVSAFTVTKKAGSGMWVFQLIFGILAVIIAAYSFAHPAVLFIAIGFLIAFYLIEAGFTLIFLADSSV